jgi:hypothetical protein
MANYLNGSFKTVKWQYWEFFNMSFKPSEYQELANDKWYINLTISLRKEIGKYWDTHSIQLNEYKPKQKQTDEINLEDIPF